MNMSPRLRSLYVRFDEKMRAAGIAYIITSTYRNDADQQALYDQGRTRPGPIVTNAKPGQSRHNAVDRNGMPAAEAFDIVIMENGKPDWNVGNPKWKIAGKIGVSVGLEWAGNWTRFREYPHFQQPKEVV